MLKRGSLSFKDLLYKSVKIDYKIFFCQAVDLKILISTVHFFPIALDTIILTWLS